MYGKFLNEVKFGIATTAIFHDDVADFFGFEVGLEGHDVVDDVGDFPQSAENSFPESDQHLFKEFLFDDGFGLGDVVFDEVHEGA